MSVVVPFFVSRTNKNPSLPIIIINKYQLSIFMSSDDRRKAAASPRIAAWRGPIPGSKQDVRNHTQATVDCGPQTCQCQLRFHPNQCPGRVKMSWGYQCVFIPMEMSLVGFIPTYRVRIRPAVHARHEPERNRAASESASTPVMIFGLDESRWTKRR